MPYLTPDTTTANVLSRRLLIPDDPTWRSIVYGALLELTYPHNWEQFGSVAPDEAAQRALEMYLAFTGETSMIGTIVPYATGTMPAGLLACDGATHLRTDYPALYAVLDAAFITDADHFVTPDLRGRAIIGAGTGTGLTARTVGAVGGAETVVLNEGQLPAHVHGQLMIANATALGAVGVRATKGNGTGTPSDGTTGNAGSGAAHANMQPFAALSYGIAYQ